ncbi:MAG: methyltransferase domain-containing protein [Bacteroidales bacterium]
MNKFFLSIYDFFISRKLLMYSVMTVLIVIMGFLALQLRFTEDITSFFPNSEKHTAMIFNNLKLKDKIVIMVPGDCNTAIERAETFTKKLSEKINTDQYADFTTRIDDGVMEKMSQYIYNNLPLFLTGEDYIRLDSLTTPKGIESAMERNYNNLLSAAGGFMDEYIYTDPLGISAPLFAGLQDMGNGINYKIIDSYLFSKDSSTLFMFLQPHPGQDMAPLIDAIESTIAEMDDQVDYFGAPAVALYNARQIKQDTMITLHIAIIIVILFITITFRNKWSILLITIPVLFGGLFALACIRLIQGEMSSIAAGSGAVVFGIALSYSIHILSHANHCSSVRQIITELAYPLTIGSFTTIGAFAGLLFTDSKLLQDFGLFSAITLIGTTLFSLIFLPHFIKTEEDYQPNKILKWVEKITSRAWEKDKWLVAGIVILTIFCSFFFQDVRFDSNMMHINYEPAHLTSDREKLEAFANQKEGESNVLFIATAGKTEEAATSYNMLCNKLDSLKDNGKIIKYSSINQFIVPQSVQTERLERWKNYWTPSKQKEVFKIIGQSKILHGFTSDAFNEFEHLLCSNYTTLNYKDTLTAQLFPDWINTSDSTLMFLSNISLRDTLKGEIYSIFNSNPDIVVADRAFYANIMAESVNHNFYLVLYISSLLIFFALLISYGRIELTLISFLPMFISWILILGLMALFSVEFNIVNVILSTFIFGIGDDFSIFIMDGLLSEYQSGKEVLAAHKSAIFFSAFAVIVGMGAFVFAEHPALKSLAFISLFGIIAVVLVSYTIQPIIFRFFITRQTRAGGFPYTLAGLLNTTYAFGLFLTGCLLIQLYILLVYLVPIGKQRRKNMVHNFTSWATRNFIKAMITNKMININEPGETFQKPAVIIANHQSFIDILLLLGLHHKLIMVTNSWVWNSPFFGKIVRFLDFHNTSGGYEQLAHSLKDKISQGYSVIVFPEGTRSKDGTIGRFHKGAFYLAELLQMDILPILIYGNGLVSSKRQPIYIKKGIVISKILPRIALNDSRFGNKYGERSKIIGKWFKQEYHLLYQQYNRPDKNNYFYNALIKNYIYKGPVLEWYMRIKVKMEKNYQLFDTIIPRSGYIVDLGCGYGPLSLMLSLLSNKRKILGIDYDQEKIEVARHCFSNNKNTEFRQGDIRNLDLPHADVFVLNDVLHYIAPALQTKVIEQCIACLNPNGKIIIRDGDSSKQQKHKTTELTEKWSTGIVKFNKTDGDLYFTCTKNITEITNRMGMNIEILNNDTVTSNTIYIITYA